MLRSAAFNNKRENARKMKLGEQQRTQSVKQKKENIL